MCYSHLIKAMEETYMGNAITPEQYHEGYELAKKVNAGSVSIKEATSWLSDIGVSENSAMMYLRCARGMLEGKRFTSRVKENAISYNLTQIYAEFHAEGLERALKSLRQYLDYQKKYTNYPGLEKVYTDFKEIL